ncbi:Cys-tRNA(Pro) deacylase [Olsenella sp. Marseille-P4559]|uniref:Cys-tRNA(Pro) deacylase n=1 Tax=Olsenella sp. Marseille-P4559 TaxID=2364795 RepID=UPI0010302EB6|nr:Cys-tRNA(Pro) deacylase [Olsenella sp. Marseille-P4559]
MARREKLQKTNAMRELERAGISFTYREVEEGNLTRGLGLRMALEAGVDPQSSFKTLVTVAPSGAHVVCCVPVGEELDFKKAAAAAGEKSLSMLPTRELEGLTGYVRGGCSPVGMKRRFPTLIDETAQLFGTIGISGGRRGLSLRLAPDDLQAFCDATYADICREEAR